MIKKWITLLALVAGGFWFSVNASAAEVAGLQHAGNDLGDRASLQRGAKLFMNYCSGCHSLKYLRYSRMAGDLGLTEEQVQQDLNFTNGGFGDHIETAMTEADGTKWFGKAPPDLTLNARVRGTDWIYTYLKSFYLDESRPTGWNNTVYANAAMPNPLWELQGVQVAEWGAQDKETKEYPIVGFTLERGGSQTADEYDQSVRDITNFLAYAAEPVGIKRQGLGVWVILFCVIFTFVAYLLKKEYWKDVEH
ncbi:MAG: cytochrome c1 [Xanthomonadaceae bacterium]|jgi:ubiquinol-cytochrome c reductase cytochrome c1 subunit|nr:cytochrome c1 [Xanthomonadaceae bacterium]